MDSEITAFLAIAAMIGLALMRNAKKEADFTFPAGQTATEKNHTENRPPENGYMLASSVYGSLNVYECPRCGHMQQVQTLDEGPFICKDCGGKFVI